MNAEHYHQTALMQTPISESVHHLTGTIVAEMCLTMRQIIYLQLLASLEKNILEVNIVVNSEHKCFSRENTHKIKANEHSERA